MKNAMWLLSMIGAVILTLQFSAGMQLIPIDRDGIHATNPCYERDSKMVGVSWLRFNKGLKHDPDCEKRESARLFAEAGMMDHTRTIICDTSGAKQTFGTVDDCLSLNRPNGQLVAMVEDRQEHCMKRAKRWYRMVAFWRVDRRFEKCMDNDLRRGEL
jgi:hypothetical protein